MYYFLTNLPIGMFLQVRREYNDKWDFSLHLNVGTWTQKILLLTRCKALYIFIFFTLLLQHGLTSLQLGLQRCLSGWSAWRASMKTRVQVFKTHVRARQVWQRETWGFFLSCVLLYHCVCVVLETWSRIEWVILWIWTSPLKNWLNKGLTFWRIHCY